MYNLCTMFGFDRKSILKEIHCLIEIGYGSFSELVSMTLQELSDIEKIVMSIKQDETLKKAGM